MLKITYAGCLGLSPAISSQFTVEMCAAAKNGKKFNKTPFFGEEGGSKSFKIIDVNKSVCQQVCTYVQPFLHYKSQ